MPEMPFRRARAYLARRRIRTERRQHFFRDILKGVEQLEDRSLLASVVWDGGGLTLNWNDADNWNPNSVPTAADDVTIGDFNPDIVVDVVVSGAPALARTLVSDERIQITGALSLGTSGSLNGGFDLAGGTLTINGPITVGGVSTWSAGTVNGSGSLTNAGTLSLTGADVKTLGPATLTNTSSVLIAGDGNLRLIDGTYIINRSGATFDLQSDADLDWFSGLPVQFANDGLLRKSAGTGTSALDLVLDNAGTMEVSSGIFAVQILGGVGAPGVRQFTGTTLSGGTWNVLNGATLDFPGAGSIATIDGQASVTLSGASATLPEINSVTTIDGTFSLAGGRSFTTTGALAVTGTLHVDATSSLTMNGAAILTLNNGGNAYIDGTLNTTSAVAISTNGTLSGSGNVAGPVTASGFGRLVPGQIGIPGTLTITGNLNLNSGTLLADIGGTTPGTQHDKLVVTGNATLTGGTFTSVLTGSFLPAAFDAFNVLSISGTRTGDFSFKNLQGAPGRYFSSAHVAPNFTLTANATTVNNWIAPGSGEWTTAGNWSAGVPNATHDVVIPFIDGASTITVSASAPVNSVTSAEHVRASSGTFTINAASSFTRGLSSSSATILATGNLDVHGSSTLTGATISGGGVYANAADGTVTMTSSITLNGTISNAGSFTQTAGQLLVNNPFGRFSNQLGGVFNEQSTVNPSMTGSGYFLNAGTFAKSGAGTTGLSTPFFNQAGGTVQVQGGILDLTGLGNGGTTHQGTFDVSSGALVRWTNGRTNFVLGASFSGAGNVQFSSGSINVYADVTASNVTLNGATLTVTPVTKTFNWTGANSAISSGNITGWGLINNTGTLGITGGTISATFSNQGTVNWTAGNVAGTGPFLNQTGANFNALVATASFSPPLDNRAGALFTRNGASTATFSGAFTNSGTVSVPVGVLNLSGGGAHSGSFAGSLGQLFFGGGTHTLTSSSSVAIRTVRFSAGIIHIHGTYEVASGGTGTTGSTSVTFHPSSTVVSVGSTLTHSSGTLTFNSGETISAPTMDLGGSATLTGSDNINVEAGGNFQWSGGTFSGSGTTTVEPGGVFVFMGGSLLGRVVINQGATHWASSNVSSFGSGAFVNESGATFQASQGGISGTFSPPFTNQVSAIVIRDGAAASATFAGTFNNLGTVRSDANILSFTGAVTQFSGGSLTGGTWTLNGGSILLPGATLVATNQGVVTVAGTASDSRELASLASNQATLSVQAGAGLVTTGPFANTGTVTIAAGSTLAAGNFPTSGLLGLWHGEGNALDAFDGNPGTLVGGAVADANGKVGKAFGFDGVNDGVTTALTPSYATGATQMAWIRTTDDTATLITGGGGQSSSRGMGLFIEPGGMLTLAGSKGTFGSFNFWIDGPAVNDGQLHHIAATWTGTTAADGVKLYVDGVLVGQATALATITTDTHVISFGGHPVIAFNRYSGTMDEIAIYNRALTPLEVQNAMAGSAYTQTAGSTSIAGRLAASTLR